MQKNLNKLKTLPAYVQAIIAALPSVIIIALFVFFIFIPKNDDIAALKTKVTKLDAEIKSGEAKVKRLDSLMVENEMLKKKLAKLKEQLPEEKEVSVLLKQVSELGLRSGLEIRLWKPEARKTSPEGLYVEIPVRVEVMAQYHKLGDFFSHISRLPRLVNISGIEIMADSQASNSSRGLISARFMALTFASVTEAELANAAAAKGK
jgi:type IV pilus assembly protein PilO